MLEPEQRREVRPRHADAAPENDDARRPADGGAWQWVALVVLLACWMAEAQM